MRLIDADELTEHVWRDRLDSRELIAQMIKDAPTIEPERKTGRWIDYSDEGFVECPFCHSATNCDDNIDDLHYCFSCGAKMEVEHE